MPIAERRLFPWSFEKLNSRIWKKRMIFSFPFAKNSASLFILEESAAWIETYVRVVYSPRDVESMSLWGSIVVCDSKICLKFRLEVSVGFCENAQSGVISQNVAFWIAFVTAAIWLVPRKRTPLSSINVYSLPSPVKATVCYTDDQLSGTS